MGNVAATKLGAGAGVGEIRKDGATAGRLSIQIAAGGYHWLGCPGRNYVGCRLPNKSIPDTICTIDLRPAHNCVSDHELRLASYRTDKVGVV